MSEIEDIFASKGKAMAPNFYASACSKVEKKLKKKRKSSAASDSSKTQTTEPLVPSKKRRLPETVVDTSHELTAPPKRQKTEKEKTSRSGENSRENLTVFQDSRGTGGRKRTEEGWLVYKEDELRINDEGGDTLLCPFDCDCCF